MKRTRHSVAEIMRILRQVEGGQAVAEICKETNISEQTFYRWKRKYGGMDMCDAQRLKRLEEENRRLKNLVADQALLIEVLKEVNAKKW
jgi:putative transposase